MHWLTSKSIGFVLDLYLPMIFTAMTHQRSNADENEILHILTLTSVTLVKVKDHVTLVRYCPLYTSIISCNNLLAIYYKALSIGANTKFSFWPPVTLKMHRMTPKWRGFVLDQCPTTLHSTNLLGHSRFKYRRKYEIQVLTSSDLENAPIDLKIDRPRPWPISYHDARHQPPRSFHAWKKWETKILHILTLTSVTLVKVKGHVTIARCCPLNTSISFLNNYLSIYSCAFSTGANTKYGFWPLMTLKMHWLTPKSIGSAPDPYPPMMRSTHLLGYSTPEKSGRQTDTHIHTQIHRRSQSFYSCPTSSGATIKRAAGLWALLMHLPANCAACLSKSLRFSKLGYFRKGPSIF